MRRTGLPVRSSEASLFLLSGRQGAPAEAVVRGEIALTEIGLDSSVLPPVLTEPGAGRLLRGCRRNGVEVARELEGQLVCVVRSGGEQEHRLWRLLLPEGLQVETGWSSSWWEQGRGQR